MQIDWSKIISVGAILMSIITIIITKKNLKKQLRLSKLEEILEITFFLKGYYASVFRAFTFMKRGVYESTEENETQSLLEAKKYKDNLIEIMTREIVIDKISRLKILSNAYLSNSIKGGNLKIRIHVISDLYYNMYMFVYSEGYAMKIESNAIIPHLHEMESFVNKIEQDIIKEMKLGYKSIDNNLKEKYFKEQFEKDLQMYSKF
ncbi:hypothetical protein [Chryseobacterium taiwanense]|uniref:DUF4760 domain-containing protein n=1 Tax=Chryseobacterium taiwanense TaxID=363331 RepID=A0A0B4CZD0_9FLAO|nr:hypothetical protein [Chryseobacterium taiwanense]KIC61727.1 hypothetical protein RM51_15120 [Chryseobacterium taiwanense]